MAVKVPKNKTMNWAPLLIIAADGSMEMQCQNCHGNMSAGGAANRTGWLEEPKCQSCHVGTANHTSTIRYTSVFTDPPSNSVQRAAVDQTFATVSNTPASGLSLYRFSAGHGGLQCEACHGSTHAEFPSTHLNDNLRNIQLQGHAGGMVECTACHTTTPANYAGGPHGMHPVAFAVVPLVTNNSTPVTFAWNFGDGTAFGTNQFSQHAYAVPGNYNWKVISTLSSARATNSGSILIGNPVMVGIAKAGSSLTLSWPNTIADMLLEGSPALGSSANWVPVTNAVSVDQNTLSVTVSPTGNIFFRLRQLW